MCSATLGNFLVFFLILFFFVILLMLKDQPAVIRAPEVTVTLCPVAGCPNKTGREAATKGGL